jgi:hypothetical protein
MTSEKGHICTCENCAIGPYTDECRYELELFYLKTVLALTTDEMSKNLATAKLSHFLRKVLDSEKAMELAKARIPPAEWMKEILG